MSRKPGIHRPIIVRSVHLTDINWTHPDGLPRSQLRTVTMSTMAILESEASYSNA